MKHPPLKVLCIDGIKAGTTGMSLDQFGSYRKTNGAKVEDEIFEGQDYTVVAASEHFGDIYYQIAERPESIIYYSGRFVVLPDQESEVIDAVEKEAIVNIEKSVV